MTWLNTIYFIIFFAAGAYISIEHQRISNILTKLPVWLIVIFCALVVYSLLKTGSEGTAAVAKDYIKGFGAAGLIALAISFKKFENILNLKIPMWMGRISYSLYLIHTPIIYVVVQTWTSLPLPGIAIVVLIASLISAQIMASLIEFPMNNFGKLLSKRLTHNKNRIT